MKARLGLVAFGLLFILTGTATMRANKQTWSNYYGSTISAIGIIGFGVVITLAGLLPMRLDQDPEEKKRSRRKRRNAHDDY